MIGLRSGKVIAYGTRTKRCARYVGLRASRKGERPRSHDCRLNWSGSSKAMEPDIGNNLFIGVRARSDLGGAAPCLPEKITQCPIA